MVGLCLLCGMVGALCFVCHRRRNKVIAAGVEEDEVIGDAVSVEEKQAGWDMTSIAVGDGQSGTADHEQEIMIDVEVTETKQ